MDRFIIEVPHKAEPQACLEAIKVLLGTGSHYLTNADFGCFDGEHKAWVLVEADSKEEARGIIPSLYRDQAKVVKLNKFSMEDIERLLRQHGG